MKPSALLVALAVAYSAPNPPTCATPAAAPAAPAATVVDAAAPDPAALDRARCATAGVPGTPANARESGYYGRWVLRIPERTRAAAVPRRTT